MGGFVFEAAVIKAVAFTVPAALACAIVIGAAFGGCVARGPTAGAFAAAGAAAAFAANDFEGGGNLALAFATGATGRAPLEGFGSRCIGSARLL